MFVHLRLGASVNWLIFKPCRWFQSTCAKWQSCDSNHENIWLLLQLTACHSHLNSPSGWFHHALLLDRNPSRFPLQHRPCGKTDFETSRWDFHRKGHFVLFNKNRSYQNSIISYHICQFMSIQYRIEKFKWYPQQRVHTLVRGTCLQTPSSKHQTFGSRHPIPPVPKPGSQEPAETTPPIKPTKALDGKYPFSHWYCCWGRTSLFKLIGRSPDDWPLHRLGSSHTTSGPLLARQNLGKSKVICYIVLYSPSCVYPKQEGKKLAHGPFSNL